jgi:para-nitrobenzyl esterase
VLAVFALAPAVAWGAPATIEDGIQVFRGIRYGMAERFRAPVAAPFSKGGPAFGPSSPQRGDRYRPVSEDCLYLNVWTPGVSVRARRPVIVYIHGGAYSTGSAVDPLLDGQRLAAGGDVVVVTIQHRLNAFGYLSLARLDPRFADSGNAGQLDLVLALQWVRDNIAAFGGDPGLVTVVGQSGGGAKIATLMGMPAARRLFHRAATMSGQQVTVSGPLHAEQRTRAYMERLRVTSVDQLLALPIEGLVEGLDAVDPILGGSLYFGPVLDMKWLDRHPFWPDAHPQSNAIPLMLGNTHDETRAFFGPDNPTIRGLAWDNLPDRIAPELRVDADPVWVVREYRALFPAYSPEQIFFAATTASRSWRAQVIEAEARAAAGAPAFVYQLDFPVPALHGADIPLLFSGEGPLVDAFLRFARTGDPGWPAYALPERRTMVFGEAPHLESDPRRAERELFARIPYIQPGT